MRVLIGGRRCRDANIDSVIIERQNESNHAKRCYLVPELRGGGGCVGKCSKVIAIAPSESVLFGPVRSDCVVPYFGSNTRP
jgi:hypothetical protein